MAVTIDRLQFTRKLLAVARQLELFVYGHLSHKVAVTLSRDLIIYRWKTRDLIVYGQLAVYGH